MKHFAVVAAAALIVAALAPSAAIAAEGPVIGAWSGNTVGGVAMPAMPTPRTNFAYAVVAGHILVAGGQTVAGDSASIVNTAEVYKTTHAAGPGANAWQLDTSKGGFHQPMPAARAGASAATVPDPYNANKRYVVVVGGIGPDVFDEDADSDVAEIVVSKSVQIYDFSTRTWSLGTPKPRPGWGATLVAIPEKFTDSNASGDWNVGEPFTDMNSNGTFDVFLQVLNGVCTIEPANCTYPDNNAYEIYTPRRPDNTVTAGVNEELPDGWGAAGAGSPPPEREAAGALTAPLLTGDTSPRYIYKIGGGTGGIIATSDVWRKGYDNSGPWEEAKRLPAARVGHASVVVQAKDAGGNNVQYPLVIGGTSDGTNPTDTVFLYQPGPNGWISEAPMAVGTTSSPRMGRPGAVVIGNNVYVFGGQGAAGVDGSIIRAAVATGNTPVPPPAENALVGPWEDIASNIPTPRSRVSYAQIGSKLYVMGGEDGSAGSVWRDSLSDAVSILDLETGSWSAGAPMPVNYARGVAAALVDADGRTRIYVVGGLNDAAKQETIPVAEVDAWPKTGAVHIYDPATNSWTAGPAMPTPRTFMGHFVYDNKLHVLGGNLPDGTQAGAPHEVFDPITGLWTADPTGTPFGGAQGGAMTVADHGANGVWAYWFGGGIGMTQVQLAARLSLTAPGATWEAVANLPTGLSGARAISVTDGPDQLPVVIGGDFGPVACALDKVFHYYSNFNSDPNLQNTWANDFPMVVDGGKVVRSGFAVALYNGYVYVAGGDAGGCALVNRTLRAPVTGSSVVDVPSLGAAEQLQDGSLVNIAAVLAVTLDPVVESGVFYAESTNREAGIRVETSGPVPTPGQGVTIKGRLGTNLNGERVIRDAEVTVVESVVPVIVDPLNVTGKSFGGVGYVCPDGSAQDFGLSNQGMLVRITGKVTNSNFIDAYWVDDGSGVNSQSDAPGIKVILTEQFPSAGDMVSVVGIVSSDVVGGKMVRVLRGRENQFGGDFESHFP